VLNTLRALARRGWRTTLLPVDRPASSPPDRLRDAISADTAVVSVMHANNEIGTIQPIAELAAIAHEHGALMHTDAVQSAGKIPVTSARSASIWLSLSAHKFNGPEGRGRVVDQAGTRHAADRDRRQARAQPPRRDRERAGDRRARRRRRAGRGKTVERGARVAALRDRLEAGILARSRARRQRRARRRGAEHDQHQLRPRRAESLLIALDLEGIAVSTGRPARRARSSRRTCCARWAAGAPHAELAALQPRDVLDRGRSRPRGRGAAALVEKLRGLTRSRSV
jgi:cysteine desulfurase